MRQIKFRVWDKPKKQMIYSDSDLSNNIQLYINGSVVWNGAFIIEEVELMQFTGLHDKNGKEIYEGDILNKKYENLSVIDGIGIVEIGVGVDSDGYNHGYWYGWKAGDSSLLDVHDEAKIIGNIHENPELLESK